MLKRWDILLRVDDTASTATINKIRRWQHCSTKLLLLSFVFKQKVAGGLEGTEFVDAALEQTNIKHNPNDGKEKAAAITAPHMLLVLVGNVHGR